MLYEIYTALKEQILTGIEGLNSVERYKGEFEDGAEWTPAYPAVKIEYTSNEPVEYSADGSSAVTGSVFTIFIANRDLNEPVVLRLLEDVINLLDGKYIDADGQGYKITYQRSQIHGYIPGGAEVHRASFTIT